MISVRRILLLQLLIETKDGASELNYLRDGLRLTDEVFNNLILELTESKTITLSDNTIMLTLSQRLDVAVKALESGADIEVVSRSLTWLEFEELCARVFEENGFTVRRRFRFSAEGRRWEIDLFASKKPWMILAECKHWIRGMNNSATIGVIEKHLTKSNVLAEHIAEISGKVGVNGWGVSTIIPIALTLSTTPLDMYGRVPCVSILVLPSFLSDFNGHLTYLATFKVSI
jgi:hypothetical protein